MPELPDVTIYVEALRDRIVGQPLTAAKALSIFVLKSVEPPLSEFVGRKVVSVERLGKRIVLGFEGELFLVIHLMIAGRLLWRRPGEGGWTPAGKLGLGTFDFPNGRLVFTEASSRKRASLLAVRGREAVERLNPGGIEPLESSLEDFAAALRRENHTLKRTLTSPRLISGIGNAYSDEILHAARLSPLKLTQSLSDEETARLHKATRQTLERWTDKLREEFAGRFPDKGQITAFRPDFATHGKFGKPCPVCGMPIQRIVYAENETNYCPRCQNEDRVLADRSLSRLLKDDWPKTVEELVTE